MTFARTQKKSGAGEPDFTENDLATLFTRVDSSPAGTLGLLVNKTDTSKRILMLKKTDSGDVKPTIDHDDGYDGNAEVPVIHFDNATPHIWCAQDTSGFGSPSTTHNLNTGVGNYSNGESGNWLVWDSANNVVRYASEPGTIVGTNWESDNTLTLGQSDLIIKLGVSEFEVGDAILPGKLASTSTGEAGGVFITPSGLQWFETQSGRLLKLFSPITGALLPVMRAVIEATEGGDTANDYAILGVADETNTQLVCGGLLGGERVYNRSQLYDATSASGAGGAAPTSGNNPTIVQCVPMVYNLTVNNVNLTPSAEGGAYDSAANLSSKVSTFSGWAQADGLGFIANGSTSRVSMTISKLMIMG